MDQCSPLPRNAAAGSRSARANLALEKLRVQRRWRDGIAEISLSEARSDSSA
ncbi:uncharacterized protein PITG_06990 [Phytophthora infestans T30-4]|uniref:Uncharacterized protein n=1 Tax=Phytophthora infestans (strain T30-4) TaxID=403677 RepID=D0N6Z6_PHYIT|nr:uncharacterized protein PITG_06990 [Phytophthora infestans T30-4]EEY53345.1 hypothetical protein PITG_06990 [Phytophthora infestans T30-4]|eukprot:XP_002904963.1 hypothetical protein PITG_06990 [Phytophthora infestans T30-4]